MAVFAGWQKCYNRFMDAERLPNGNILIPIRADDESGKTIGDAMVEIGPDHPDYKAWDEYLKSQ